MTRSVKLEIAGYGEVLPRSLPEWWERHDHKGVGWEVLTTATAARAFATSPASDAHALYEAASSEHNVKRNDPDLVLGQQLIGQLTLRT